MASASLVIATALAVWTQPVQRVLAPLGFPSLDHASAWQLHLVRALALLPSLLGGAALFAMSRLFRAVASGELFSERTAGHLTRFSGIIVAGLIVSAIVPPASSAVLSVGTAPGQGRLVLTAGSNHGFALIGALAFYVLSRLLREAGRIERENAEFV